MEWCVKCGKDGPKDGLNIIVEGGVEYTFCRDCDEDLQSSPTGTVTAFLADKRESWVQKNMREAKERRERGESMFINKHLYRSDQTCRFCDNPDSILTKETCCTGCSKLVE